MRIQACLLMLAMFMACGSIDERADPGPGFPDVIEDAAGDAATDPGDAGQDVSADPGDAGQDVSADSGEGPSVLEGPVVDAHPGAFARISGFKTVVSGFDVGANLSREKVDGPVTLEKVGFLGALGTGNGHVFGQVGLATPLNTLHSLVGPTYERRPNFFGDYAVMLAPSGVDFVPFEQEWAGRSLSAPVVFTEGRLGGLLLQTIDFAPPADSGDARYCFVRLLTVRNLGQSLVADSALRVMAYKKVPTPEDGVLVEKSGTRSLTTRFAQTGAVAAERTLTMAVGALEAGEDRVFTLFHCATEGEGPVPVPQGDPGDWLDKLALAYGDWDAGLVQVDVPEPWVADFLDGMKMTLKVQTASTGATCPMSEYTRTWARDNIGPVMALLDLGAHEDVEGMLDYLYAAIRYRGDLGNSYAADLDPTGAPEPPDWESLGTLSAKESAETPSYMVIMYGLHYRFTGSLDRVAERWGLLRRCIFDVAFGPDHLLSFTGDETFRTAMNVAFGLSLEYPHHEQSWSANSSALWLGAAREFERLAAAQALDDQIDEILALSADVESSTVTHYIGEDGCLASFIDQPTMDVYPPFEDVSLQVTWSGWKNGDDPIAVANVACLVDRLSREPGVLQSDLHPDYLDMFDGYDEGIYTGMLPGYTLAALTDVGHPDAGAALQAVRQSLDTSGNLQEYMLFQERKGLSLIYDQVGTVGDYTAKFRPWEGGIVADAVFRYLVGLRPDAVTNTLDFRPHLPAGWDRMAFANLRVGAGRYDLVVERDKGAVVVTIASRAPTDATVTVRWDAFDGFPPGFAVNGAPVDEVDITRFSHFGQASARTPAITLAAGGSIAVRALPGDCCK